MILDPLRACVGVRWSARVADLDIGELDQLDAQQVLPTASVGKVFLLLTVADHVERGVVDADERLEPVADDAVADSGLLQHFGDQRLAIGDLARLVGAVSDNLATNVLLGRVGLPAVAELTRSLGVTESALNDVVRDERRPGEHAVTLSHGTGAEWSRLAERLDRGALVTGAVSARVRDWLSSNTDLSMVASAFALDPLAHRGADQGTGFSLFNKTGTDTGTRADVGVVGLGPRRVAYAVIARWDGDDLVRRSVVLDALRSVGAGISEHLAR